MPALSAMAGPTPIDGIRLHRIGIEPRRIVAMFPTHCRNQEPYTTLLGTLREAGAGLRLPTVTAMPPFIARHAAEEADRPGL